MERYYPKIILLLWALSLFAYTPLYGQCEKTTALMEQGKAHAEKQQYKKAIQAYTAVMIICPEQAEAASAEVLKVFEAIEKLKRQAELDKQRAENQQKRAELNEKKATIQAYTSKSLVMTSQAKDWAKEGLYTEALALLQAAYDTAQLNDAHPPTPLQVALADIYYSKESTWQKTKFNLHAATVNSVAFAPDGKSILTGSDDKTAILWDLQGKQIQTFKGPYKVRSVVFAPDGKSILTGGSEGYQQPGTAILWDLQGKQIQTFKGHTDEIKSVAFAPDGKSILTGSEDKTAILWDLQGNQIKTFKGHTSTVNSVAFAPDGKSILTGSSDGTAILWDLQGKQIQTFKGHANRVYSVAFAPDGKSILTGNFGRTYILWDLQGKPIHTFKGEAISATSPVAFAPDGKSILTGNWEDGTAILRDLQGNQIQTFNGYTSWVNSVAFAPDGKSILTGSGDGTAILWDLKGKTIKTFKGSNPIMGFFDPNPVAFAPDGKSILTRRYDKTAILWDLQGKPIQTFKGHTGRVICVAFAPDGKSILTGSLDRTAILWDLQGKIIQTFKEPQHTDWGGEVISMAFAPDGKSILTGSSDGTAILWDLQGKIIQTFKGNNFISSSFDPNPVAFAPDGKSILTGGNNGYEKPSSPILWDLQGKIIQTFEGHTDVVISVAFAPDGKSILTGSRDTAILWNLQGKPIQTFMGDNRISTLNPVAFAPDGKSIITVKNDRTVICDLKGKPIQTFDVVFKSVVFAPDGKSISIIRKNDENIMQVLTVAGIKGQVAYEYLRPEQQETVGLNIMKQAPQNPLKPWALWSHGQYWEGKKEYQKAKSFYQQYAQLYNTPQAHIALSRVSKELKQTYTYNFAGSKDANALLYYGEHLKDSTKQIACYQKVLSIEERPLARISLHKITQKGQEDFLNTDNPIYLSQYAEYFQEIEVKNDTLGYQNLHFSNQLYQKASTLKPHLTTYDSTSWANIKGDLTRYALLTGKPQEALQFCQEGLVLDTRAKEVKRSLAPAYLLNGKYDEAKKIYEEMKEENYNRRKYSKFFLADLEKLEKAGLISEHHQEEAEKVRELLEDE